MMEDFIKLSEVNDDETLQEVFSLLQQLRPNLSFTVFVDLKFKMNNFSAYDAIIMKNGFNYLGYISYEIQNRYSFGGKFLYIADFVIDIKHRSKGYGRLLLNRVKDIAYDNDCKNIVLESGFSREDAHKFYENNGFEKQSYSFRINL